MTEHTKTAQPTTGQANASFDPTWETVFQQQEWGKYPGEHVIRFVARNFYKVPDRKAVRILDLGCGPGACTWFMAREGFSVSSIDGSKTAIDRLEKRLAGDGLQVDARVGDIVNLPWEDSTFDAVVDNGCLCCNSFKACQGIVSEVHRVLKPGGLFNSCNFTDRSCGYGDGPQMEPGEFAHVNSGTLVGKGFILFMGMPQVDLLYSKFASKSVETISWTAANRTEVTEMWVVNAKKAV